MSIIPGLVDDEEDVFYPSSDGRPMAETDLHRDTMVDAIESLKMFYQGKRVYVSGNILLYYRPGNRRKHVSPDVLVAKDLEPHRRDVYLVWQEGKPPDVVIEMTSKTTRDEDLEDKYEIYQALRVQEYFLFDPRAEYLNPPLQGYRLVDDQFVRIETVAGRLPSEQMGLHLQRNGSELRFLDPSTGHNLPTLSEARDQAEAARHQEAAARQRADAELERLRRELESLRRQQGI